MDDDGMLSQYADAPDAAKERWQEGSMLGLFKESAWETLPEFQAKHTVANEIMLYLTLPATPVLIAIWPLLWATSPLIDHDKVRQDTCERQLRWLVWMRLLARCAARAPQARASRAVTAVQGRVINSLPYGDRFKLRLEGPQARHGRLEVTIHHAAPRPTEDDGGRKGFWHGATVMIEAHGAQMVAGFNAARAHNPDFPLTLHVRNPNKARGVATLRWDQPADETDPHSDPSMAMVGTELADFVDEVLLHAGVGAKNAPPPALKALHLSRAESTDISPPLGEHSTTLVSSTPLPRAGHHRPISKLLGADGMNAKLSVIWWLMVGLSTLLTFAVAVNMGLIAGMLSLGLVLYLWLGAKMVPGGMLRSMGSGAVPRWNTDALTSPLNLSRDGILSTPKQTIDLNRPFQVSLSRAQDMAGRLHVHLTQRGQQAAQVERLTLAVHSQGASEQLQVLDTDAQWVSSQDFARWLWPNIRAYAQSHGTDCPWDFSLASEAGKNNHAPQRTAQAREAHQVHQVHTTRG